MTTQNLEGRIFSWAILSLTFETVGENCLDITVFSHYNASGVNKQTRFPSQAQYDLSMMIISSGLQSKAFVAVDNPAHEAISYKLGWHNLLTVMLPYKLVDK
jgi:hypothetical protein